MSLPERIKNDWHEVCGRRKSLVVLSDAELHTTEFCCYAEIRLSRKISTFIFSFSTTLWSKWLFSSLQIKTQWVLFTIKIWVQIADAPMVFIYSSSRTFCDYCNSKIRIGFHNFNYVLLLKEANRAQTNLVYITAIRALYNYYTTDRKAFEHLRTFPRKKLFAMSLMCFLCMTSLRIDGHQLHYAMLDWVCQNRYRIIKFIFTSMYEMSNSEIILAMSIVIKHQYSSNNHFLFLILSKWIKQEHYLKNCVYTARNKHPESILLRKQTNW